MANIDDARRSASVASTREAKMVATSSWWKSVVVHSRATPTMKRSKPTMVGDQSPPKCHAEINKNVSSAAVGCHKPEGHSHGGEPGSHQKSSQPEGIHRQLRLVSHQGVDCTVG